MPSPPIRLATAVTALGLTLVAAFPPSVAAVAPPDAPPSTEAPAEPTLVWGVQPSSADGPDGRAAFDYTLEPGEVVEDHVGVTNHGTTPIELRVYASDAFTTADGGFDLLTAGQAPVDVGAWIDVDQEWITLQPGERSDIGFSLEIPANATPGDHAGGIVASYSSASGEGGAVTVDQRVGARVYLRVDGQLDPSLVVDEFTVEHDGSLWPWNGAATVRYEVRNAGNLRLAGEQELRISGPSGFRASTRALDPLPELLPGATHAVEVELDDVWASGRLSADLTITPTEPAPATRSALAPVTARARVGAVPWSVVVVAAIAAITGWVRWRLKRPAAGAAGDGHAGSQLSQPDPHTPDADPPEPAVDDLGESTPGGQPDAPPTPARTDRDTPDRHSPEPVNARPPTSVHDTLA